MANTADPTERRGQIISMTEWRVPDSSAPEDRPHRRGQPGARRRAARAERRPAWATRPRAGVAQRCARVDIDGWCDALGGFDCA